MALAAVLSIVAVFMSPPAEAARPYSLVSFLEHIGALDAGAAVTLCPNKAASDRMVVSIGSSAYLSESAYDDILRETGCAGFIDGVTLVDVRLAANFIDPTQVQGGGGLTAFAVTVQDRLGRQFHGVYEMQLRDDAAGPAEGVGHGSSRQGRRPFPFFLILQTSLQKSTPYPEN